jgi:hypothetical protein
MGTSLSDKELLIHDPRVIPPRCGTNALPVDLADVLDIAVEIAEVVIAAHLLQAGDLLTHFYEY